MAMLTGVATNYPLSNWCKGTEQADITLNMMRPCLHNPALSAHEAMEGMFSFDATPMAPFGTEMMIHIKPNRRRTWGYHALRGWYFAPALNHYRVVKAVTDSGAVRLTDTFKFNHHTLPVPSITPTDRIVKATRDLRNAINGDNDAPPDELEAIANLRQLITGTRDVPPPPPPLPIEASNPQDPDNVDLDPVMLPSPPSHRLLPGTHHTSSARTTPT